MVYEPRYPGLDGIPPIRVLIIRRPNPRSPKNGQSDPLDSMGVFPRTRGVSVEQKRRGWRERLPKVNLLTSQNLNLGVSRFVDLRETVPPLKRAGGLKPFFCPPHHARKWLTSMDKLSKQNNVPTRTENIFCVRCQNRQPSRTAREPIVARSLLARIPLWEARMNVPPQLPTGHWKHLTTSGSATWITCTRTHLEIDWRLRLELCLGKHPIRLVSPRSVATVAVRLQLQSQNQGCRGLLGRLRTTAMRVQGRVSTLGAGNAALTTLAGSSTGVFCINRARQVSTPSSGLRGECQEGQYVAPCVVVAGTDLVAAVCCHGYRTARYRLAPRVCPQGQSLINREKGLSENNSYNEQTLVAMQAAPASVATQNKRRNRLVWFPRCGEIECTVAASYISSSPPLPNVTNALILAWALPSEPPITPPPLFRNTVH
uniref:Uncharacterized protein n=1 Tax=Timema bartmani TaxID=61472 RepID=A0A7R9ESD5_9NEOP|nr:unnamed protein product [Timema bartmani]